jgi:hypothetical protein
MLIIVSSVIISPSIGISVTKIHDDNITGNISDPECSGCHLVSQSDHPQQYPIQQNNDLLFDLMGDSNYNAILTIGQTPYQLGPFFKSTNTGWSWWDSADFGAEKQKNLINLMILDKTTGKPVTGLTSYPTWPQASFRKYSGSYSYKADAAPSPITNKVNYTNNIDLWMIKSVDLTGYSNANLTFKTWYAMEKDFDYGYVAVSINGGIWNNLPGTLTTTNNPNNNNLGNGITGNSSGWVQETMDMSSYAGNKIFLAFRFKSDDASNDEGWYVDDINVVSGIINIFNDDAETPTTLRTLSVNVSYPHLNLLNPTDPLTSATTLQYLTYIQQVNVQEDISHPGTYLGYFKYDSFQQYSGNYSVSLDTIINGSQVTANTHFQTTVFGCQSCHNKKLTGVETSFAHGEGSGGMESCMFICHGGSRGFLGGSNPTFGPLLDANPMHVHEMQYGHVGGFLKSFNYPQPNYTVQSHVNTTTCIQCHTSFLHTNNSVDTMKIANYTLYGENISFSSGTHGNLTCEFCHGSLAYPPIPQNQFQLQGSLGKYKPSFTSHESFTDTYILNVNRSDNLTITVIGDNTAQIIELYIVGPVDNTSTALQPCGDPCRIAQSISSPITTEIQSPYIGTWIVKLTELQEGTINYTISSNYPIESKPIIKIPECNSCHNSTADGKARTTDVIPDWNPGFAHADTNNDGTLDVQCRMCHDAMHNIVVKDCKNCHLQAPVNHVIKEPLFSEYTPANCLECHGDPHRVTSEGGTDCIACHSPGDVNISLFGKHAIINNSNSVANVTNDDCWTCHYQKDMNRSHVYLCESCHLNSSGIVNVTNTSLIKSDFMHGITTCKICHAPATSGVPSAPAYHLNGSVGPLGLVERILGKMK